MAGKDNFVADSFSRLYANNQKPNTPPTEDLGAITHEIFPHPLPDATYTRIAQAHNADVGHFGVDKTFNHLISIRQKWKGMRKHIRQFIQLCPVCQKLRERHLALKAHPFTTAAYLPMDVLNIDTIGPVDSDDDGNKFILVIVDCFTRWVELFPMPDTSAISAAEAILQHVGRYGIPSTIRSNRGSQFVNEIITQLIQLMHSDHAKTLAYSKEENAIVERANKEVMRHLRAIIFDRKSQRKWSKHHLPLVMRILNSEEKTNTGLSPAEILFGNTVDLGRRILHEPFESSPDSSQPLSVYMEKLLADQASLIQVAQATQLKHDTHHMSTFSPNFTEFPVNSYVLLDPPEGSRSKLQTRKKGPYQVVNSVGSKYVLQDLLSGKNFETHYTNLSPFNFDEDRTSPTDVAMHDEQEFLIDKIIAHRGDRTRRSTMEFLVKWTGFGDTYDSWEPYANLRDTSSLSEYLAANRLRSLLPKARSLLRTMQRRSPSPSDPKCCFYPILSTRAGVSRIQCSRLALAFLILFNHTLGCIGNSDRVLKMG